MTGSRGSGVASMFREGNTGRGRLISVERTSGELSQALNRALGGWDEEGKGAGRRVGRVLNGADWAEGCQ
jgi:hypothetical protein